MKLVFQNATIASIYVSTRRDDKTGEVTRSQSVVLQEMSGRSLKLSCPKVDMLPLTNTDPDTPRLFNFVMDVEFKTSERGMYAVCHRVIQADELAFTISKAAPKAA
jgi:hypothetical protein